MLNKNTNVSSYLHAEGLGVDRRTILEWMLRKWCQKLWTEFIWFRIRTGDRLL